MRFASNVYIRANTDANTIANIGLPYFKKSSKATYHFYLPMHPQKLRVLIEAFAITLCLVALAGQQSQAGTSTSQAKFNGFRPGFYQNTALLVNRNP
jgi:hypothetical protein